MKQKPALFRFFRDELYQFGFWVVLGSPAAITASMSKTHPRFQSGAVVFEHDGMMIYQGSRRRIFILISENHNGPADMITTLCHEAFHATCLVMSEAGVKLGKKSEEAFAYHLDFVFEKCLTRLNDMERAAE